MVHNSTRRKKQEFRADIEGLRAVAVLLVLGYHAGIPWLPGGFIGVDVFFVISGFLITGLIFREIKATGRLNLARFYGRRIRRLLPAIAVVLGTVALLTIVFLPVVRWERVAGDLLASAVYVVNWRFAGQSVDYLASEEAPSPVQHFWSLAVEEQFYIVWPILIIALLSLHRRSGWSLNKTLLVGLAMIGIPSLAWSVYLTASAPGAAYFVSTTRAWELALGAAVALTSRRLALMPNLVASVLGWAGLVMVVLAALTFDGNTAFPGYAALIPTLGAAALIAGGLTDRSPEVNRMLSVQPMRDIGVLSYSLYLWHWPLLVAATAAWGELSWSRGVLVVGFSVVPAWLTYRLVEAPIHHSRRLAFMPRATVGVAVMCTILGVAAAGVVYASMPRSSSPDVVALGAAVLEKDPANDPDGVPADGVEVALEDVVAAREDIPVLYRNGCHVDEASTELPRCVYGDENSDQVVALVGDSHAAQWHPALEAIANERGWRLETYTKSACGFFSVQVASDPNSPYDECAEWNRALLERLTGADKPDVVIASGSMQYSVVKDGEILEVAASRPHFVDGLVRSWREVRSAGVELTVILNTPWIGVDIPDCLSTGNVQQSECAVPKAEATGRAGGDAQIDAASQVEGVELVDLTDAVCPAAECSPVIGNVVVWRDKHHLTATYAKTLAPHLENALDRAIKSSKFRTEQEPAR